MIRGWRTCNMYVSKEVPLRGRSKWSWYQGGLGTKAATCLGFNYSILLLRLVIWA